MYKKPLIFAMRFRVLGLIVLPAQPENLQCLGATNGCCTNHVTSACGLPRQCRSGDFDALIHAVIFWMGNALHSKGSQMHKPL